MYLIEAKMGTFIQYLDATGRINTINSCEEPYETKAEAKKGIRWIIEHNWLDLKDYKQVKFSVIPLN